MPLVLPAITRANDSYRKNPKGSWGFACIGCHAETEGARDHMQQNGAPFPIHE